MTSYEGVNNIHSDVLLNWHFEKPILQLLFVLLDQALDGLDKMLHTSVLKW